VLAAIAKPANSDAKAPAKAAIPDLRQTALTY
jgi:hypothetical protein